MNFLQLLTPRCFHRQNVLNEPRTKCQEGWTFAKRILAAGNLRGKTEESSDPEETKGEESGPNWKQEEIIENTRTKRERKNISGSNRENSR